jgi:peptide chain release factor subunit 3
MNPSASEWKPSPSASAWTPGQSFTVNPPAPAVAADSAPTPTDPAPTTETVVHDDDDQPMTEEMDDNDPLWQAVLKISNGDRAQALAMINDPDSLAEHAEIQSILASSPMDTGDTEVDDWEQQPDHQQRQQQSQQSGEDADLAKQVEDKMNIVADDSTAAAAAPSKATQETMADDDGDIEEEIDTTQLKEGDPREHLNLVFIGHVDAGKSTLSGSILYITENVDKRTIERYEKEAKERNRESWFLAFIMDTNEEERAKGKTVEVGKAHFETSVKRYTILDAPGHKNYVPNMIMGASQADVGMLVISARKGEFETGFDRGGQTREHALLAKTLGVSYLVVVVNKMDDSTVNWSKDRYDECVTKLRPFLKSCGYVIKKEVKFIPISGLTGANVKDEVDKSLCSWWNKSWTSAENNTTVGTLMGLLDSLEIQGRNSTAPLRIPIMDRYTDRGTIAMGKVESGVVRPGMKITLMPTRTTFKIDAVWSNEDPVAAARPGENVLLKLSGAGVEDVRKGYVACTAPACRAVDKIICQMAIVDMPENTRIMTAGFQAILHAHCCEEECTIVKIFETTNNKGLVVKGARFVSVGMKCICLISVERAIPVETYDDYPFLGRFTLRTEGKTIAIGKITKLPPKKT